MTAVCATAITAKASGSSLVLWLIGEHGNSEIVQIKCVSESHAGELAAAANRAFGVRSAENSFTTSLLHRDLEIACGL